MTTNRSKKSMAVSDLAIVIVFFMVVFLMFLRSARSNSLYNSCPNLTELETIIQQETKNTFLDNERKITPFRKTIFSLYDYLSSYSFTNNLLLYFNPKYPLSVNCSSCYESEPCDDNREEPFFYPKQISMTNMILSQKNQPGITKHYIVIQEPGTPKQQISVLADYVSIFDLADYVIKYPKDHPIYILGYSYLETRIASESLVRNGFQKVYRVITLLTYPKNTEV